MAEVERTSQSDPEAKPADDAGGDVYLKRIARNAGVTAGGNLLGQVASPIIGIITTNALGPSLYGVYTLATYWAGLLAEISRFGFGATVIRFTASFRGEGKTESIKGTILYSLRLVAITSGILAVGMALLAEPFCRYVLEDPSSADAFRFFSVAILLTALYGSVTSALTGLQQQRYVVLTNSIVSNLVKIVSLLLFVWMGLDLYAALASSLLQDLAVLALGGFFLLRSFPALTDKNVKATVEPRDLWKYSLSMFATSLFYKYTFGLDITFLGYYRAAADVGLYAVALKLQPVIFIPAYAISEIFNPMVAELHAKNEIGQIERLYKTVTKWTLTLSVPIYLLIVLFYQPILRLFGKEFGGAADALMILATANLLVNFVGMAGYVINMIGRPTVNLVNSIVTAVINIGLFFLLIPPFGVTGAATAYATGLLVINLVRAIQVRRFLGIIPFKVSQLKVVAAALLSLGGDPGAAGALRGPERDPRRDPPGPFLLGRLCGESDTL